MKNFGGKHSQQPPVIPNSPLSFPTFLIGNQAIRSRRPRFHPKARFIPYSGRKILRLGEAFPTALVIPDSPCHSRRF